MGNSEADIGHGSLHLQAWLSDQDMAESVLPTFSLSRKGNHRERHRNGSSPGRTASNHSRLISHDFRSAAQRRFVQIEDTASSKVCFSGAAPSGLDRVFLGLAWKS